MDQVFNDVLSVEYGAILLGVGHDATDKQIVAALVQDADWTEKGAREVLQLAKKYGTSILRNALALAEAMNIEDGSAGF